MADLSGRQLGPYLLQKKLGQGGMGAVYVGVHQTLQTERAIKVLLPTEVDEAVVERFVREGVISASLRHPNIVEIFDVGEQDDIHFLVMELVDGVSLLQLLRKEGAVPLDRVVVMLRQIASALDYAHARGVVHRDIKPSNIIVGPDDEVTLIDFGIARAMDESRLTRVGMVVGTFEYMAPEIVTEGGGSPGADRYALGVVAYQMLTGRTPFGGESAHSIMYKQVHETPPPPTRFRGDLPPGVDGVLLRQLAKQPDTRYASSQAFVDALADVAQQGPMTEDATALGEVTRPGFEPRTPGSGQTPFPRSGRATRPVPAPASSATMTPPGATAMPGVSPRPAPPPPMTSPGAQPSTTPAPYAPRTPIPAAPAASYTPAPAAPPTAGTWPGAPVAPGTVLGAPVYQQPKKSSAGLIVGIVAALAALLLVAVVAISPLRERASELIAGAPATATAVPVAKPAVTAAPTTPPTTAPAAPQPKPGPTTQPATAQPPAGATAPTQPKPGVTPPAPTVPPTSAAPPTMTADQRLAQARAASAAGNHASALSMLDDLRRGSTSVPGLDDAQYDVHMAFGRSLLDGANVDGSIEQFESALKVRPGDGAAQDGRKLAILTRNYAQMEAAWDKDQELAIKLLEENMQLDADFRETRQKLYALLIMKADRLLGAGERDAAFPVLMRALDVLPDAGEAQRRLVSYTPTPAPTATPRPVVAPQQPAQQQPATQPRPSGGSYSPPPSSSGGSSCPGGVCP